MMKMFFLIFASMVLTSLTSAAQDSLSKTYCEDPGYVVTPQRTASGRAYCQYVSVTCVTTPVESNPYCQRQACEPIAAIRTVTCDAEENGCPDVNSCYNKKISPELHYELWPAS